MNFESISYIWRVSCSCVFFCSVLLVLLPVLLLLMFTGVLLACSPCAVKWDCPLSIAASFFLYLSRSVSQCGEYFGYQVVILFSNFVICTGSFLELFATMLPQSLQAFELHESSLLAGPMSGYIPVNILPPTCNRSVTTSVSSPINSSRQICIKTLFGHHADHRNPSDEPGDWLIPPNWWMMSSIWNGHPNGTPPPPLLPGGCHPRLICTNLINTLTGTPGLFTEEAAAAAAAATRTAPRRTNTWARMLPRWAFDSSNGGRHRDDDCT